MSSTTLYWTCMTSICNTHVIYIMYLLILRRGKLGVFALPFLQDKKKFITEVYIMNIKFKQQCQQFQQYQPNPGSDLCLYLYCPQYTNLQDNIFQRVRVYGVIASNATFNNISVILWQSILLVEQIEVHWENYRPVASHLQIYYIMLYRVHLALGGFKLKTSVVIGTDCKGSLSPYDHDLDCSFLSL